MPAIPELSPTEFRERWPTAPNADVTLLDVREPAELALATVAGTLHIPMRDVPARLAELPSDRPLVVMCHGGRAAGASRNSSLPTGSRRYSTFTAASMPGRSKSTRTSHVTEINYSIGSEDDGEHEYDCWVLRCSAGCAAARPQRRRA